MPNAEDVEEGIRRRKAYGGKASDAARTILYVIISKKWKGPAHPRIEDLSLVTHNAENAEQRMGKLLGA